MTDEALTYEGSTSNPPSTDQVDEELNPTIVGTRCPHCGQEMPENKAGPQTSDEDADKESDEQAPMDQENDGERSEPVDKETRSEEVPPFEPVVADYDPNEIRKDKPRFAMPDGSYPIDNCHDVHSAAVLAHHSGSYSFDAIKRHVMSAKSALGCPDSALPATWSSGSAPRSFNTGEGETKVSGTVERRNVTIEGLELRAHGDPEAPESYTIVGYAAVFDKLSENLGGFREKISEGAFRKAILRNETVALWNHDDRFPLANIDTGTLRLNEDKHGLRCEIDLDPNVSYARDLLYNVRSGRVSKMSFGFTTDSDEWADGDDGQQIRTLTGIRRLLDVSPVTSPAYRDTEVSARALLTADELRNRQLPGEDPRTSAGRELLLLQAKLISKGM